MLGSIFKNFRLKGKQAEATSANRPAPLKIGRRLSFKEYKLLKKKNATPRYTLPCLHCRKDMFLSRGQIVYFHRACRTIGRNRNAKYNYKLKLP